MSIDYLFNHGYAVDGYGNDVVYLRNINEIGYTWPDATLYYDGGGLAGSEFSYSTVSYDTSRYNAVYRRLVNLYGAPVTQYRPTGGLGATWFGQGNAYVQLEFRPMTSNGMTRFFTILQYGN